jgi:Tfp pilus assembly protein PilZ
MELRRERRIQKNLLANISTSEFEGMGLVHNISKNGIFLLTPEIFPSFKEIFILLGVSDDTYAIRGKVMWSKKHVDPQSNYISGKAGVKITKSDKKYTQLIEKLTTRNRVGKRDI